MSSFFLHYSKTCDNPFEIRCEFYSPIKNTLLQNEDVTYWYLVSVLLPYEFTLLQNLKRGLKLLPVYV